MQVFKLMDVADCMRRHELEHKDLIDFTVGYDGAVCLLLSSPIRPGRRSHVEHYMLILQVDWEKGTVLSEERHDFGEQKELFNFIRPFGSEDFAFSRDRKRLLMENGEDDMTYYLFDIDIENAQLSEGRRERILCGAKEVEPNFHRFCGDKLLFLAQGGMLYGGEFA